MTNQLFSDVPRAVTEEQMGVVMSLFQRGNDNQKFLVTLNGYNNNVTKEKNYSEDDDERLVMEASKIVSELRIKTIMNNLMITIFLFFQVNDEDELLFANPQNETFVDNELSLENDEVENTDKNEMLENNEHDCSSENVKMVEEEEQGQILQGEEEEEEEEQLVRKRRKLSPIIYTRSRSPTPDQAKSSQISQMITPVDKRATNVSSTSNEKARDKCRYWPTCTLGNKCAYLHPKVPCR